MIQIAMRRGLLGTTNQGMKNKHRWNTETRDKNNTFIKDLLKNILGTESTTSRANRSPALEQPKPWSGNKTWSRHREHSRN